MPVSEKEVEAIKRAFLHEIAEEIRGGNSDWVIGPCLNRAARAAAEAADRIREEAELERNLGVMKALHVESLREQR